jgi:hypothetical protein
VPDTIVVDATVPQPDPVAVTSPVLAPNTMYYLIVVPEDEARNLYPSDFDPLEDLSASSYEECIETPDCAVEPRCLHRLRLRDREPPDPALGDCFTAPGARGITLDPTHVDVESPYLCPLSPGDPEPEAVLLGGDPLIYYQVDDTPNLRVRADRGADTLVFDF